MSLKKTTINQVLKAIVLPRKNFLLLGLLLIIISRLSGLILPGASKYLIDDVIVNGDEEMLKQLVLVVLAAIVVQSVTSFALTRILSVQAEHLIAQLRAKVQKHIIQLPISFFDSQKSGTLVSRIMNDVQGVQRLVGSEMMQFCGGGLTAIVSFAMLIIISPMMTLYVLLPIGAFGIVSSKVFSYIRPIFQQKGEIQAEVNGRITETIGGIRVIKGFGSEEQEINVFEKGVLKIFDKAKKSLIATAWMNSSATLLLGLASTGIMGIGGYMMIHEELTLGELVSFTFYLGYIIAPVAQMGDLGSQIAEAFAGLDRTEEVMSIKTESDDQNRKVELKDIDGHIKFDKVSFSYEENKKVIKEISFEAPKGSVTALVGTSGSGKSTIAGLVSSFSKPDQGTITLDGQDLSKVILSSYRKHLLGVVFQDDFLFEGTIRENIIFSRTNASKERLLTAVKAAHVDEFTDKFEDGLDTLIGERGVKLSGGQRQRIAIARAILADPKILILDEATSNLDTESESMIQESLKSLIQGRTTFVIAHRLSTIKQADQILVIEEGQIVESGTHDELIAVQGRYYDLFTNQAKI